MNDTLIIIRNTETGREQTGLIPNEELAMLINDFETVFAGTHIVSISPEGDFERHQLMAADAPEYRWQVYIGE